jgi:hypothetical protein
VIRLSAIKLNFPVCAHSAPRSSPPISVMPGAADNVLSNASILRHITDFVGFGSWLPVAAVNSSWHKAYKATTRKTVVVPKLFSSSEGDRDHFSSSRTKLYDGSITSYSAVCETPSRLTMAHQHGLDFLQGNWRLQRIAGRAASIEVSVLAHEYGMPYSRQVLVGAIESGDINTIQWLQHEQGCIITSDLRAFAAASGQLHVLKYLASSMLQ